MTSTLLAYDPNQVKPGWIAFFIVMALLAATFLLWWNMNTQLGKIRVPTRASFAESDRTGEPPRLDSGDVGDADLPRDGDNGSGSGSGAR